MTVTVRALEARDRAGWEPLWRGYLAFYQTTRAPAQFDLQFARLTDASEAAFAGLVAEADGKLSGLAHLIFHPHGWQPQPVAYLQDLFVLPEQRGRGVGRALIEAAFSTGTAAGAEGIYWLTQSFNHEARRLYDRVGTATPFIKYVRAC